MARVFENSFGYKPITVLELFSLSQFEFEQAFLAGTHFSCAEMLNHLNQKRFIGRVIGCDDCDIPEFEALVRKPFTLHVMKLDKGFAYYIYNGLKSVLDIILQYPDADEIAQRFRQLDKPFQFSRNGDNQLSQWTYTLLEVSHD